MKVYYNYKYKSEIVLYKMHFVLQKRFKVLKVDTEEIFFFYLPKNYDDNDHCCVSPYRGYA